VSVANLHISPPGIIIPVNTSSTEQKHIEIFTDGACTGNPGPGGYGVIVTQGGESKELSGGFRRTTNNRMELIAAIVGLQALESPSKVTLYTDSQYLANGISKGWAKKWRSNNWMRTPKDPAINPDLWATLLDLCDWHQVTFQWVRGHAGHTENERCDRLSVAAAGGRDLPPDHVYEKQPAKR
jgi:ribonuclease HI